jgi:hypothetical protein
MKVGCRQRRRARAGLKLPHSTSHKLKGLPCSERSSGWRLTGQKPLRALARSGSSSMMRVPGHWQKKVERRLGRPNRPGPTVRTGYLVGLAQAYQEAVSLGDTCSIGEDTFQIKSPNRAGPRLAGRGRRQWPIPGPRPGGPGHVGRWRIRRGPWQGLLSAYPPVDFKFRVGRVSGALAIIIIIMHLPRRVRGRPVSPRLPRAQRRVPPAGGAHDGAAKAAQAQVSV